MDKRIGVQFYTIHDSLDTIENFDKACGRVSDIGYKIVQISGTALPASEMKQVLDKYGLEVVTTHRSYYDFTTNPDQIIEYNKTLGSSMCGLGIMPRPAISDTKAFCEFIENVNKFCEMAKKENMCFGYHNHSVEFIKQDGKMIIDRIIEETDPETCNFIVDTFWVQNGGKNPEDFIRSLGKRAKAVHFKDYAVDPVLWDKEAPRMKEVGNGVLNWDGIIRACEEAGTQWALVEQDKNWINDDPFEALKTSYDYLTKKGFI